jgi:leucyl-tRNA synthetase
MAFHTVLHTSATTSLRQDCVLQDIVDKFGADTTRLFILFKAPPDKVLLWDNAGILGQRRWLNRLWALVSTFVSSCNTTAHDLALPSDLRSLSTHDKQLLASTLEAIHLITADINERRSFNTVCIRPAASNAAIGVDITDCACCCMANWRRLCLR